MNNIYLIVLYDYYKELLTDRQKDYFESYYFHNLSLGEIGTNMNVSRNAIHKELKIIENKLTLYEEKLGLYKKDQELLSLVKKINDEKLKSKLIELIEK